VVKHKRKRWRDRTYRDGQASVAELILSLPKGWPACGGRVTVLSGLFAAPFGRCAGYPIFKQLIGVGPVFLASKQLQNHSQILAFSPLNSLTGQILYK